MIIFIKEAWKLSRKIKADREDKQERELIAQLFNNRYTYRIEYIKGLPRLPGNSLGGSLFNPTSGYAWMCPICNKIHHPVESSMFSGLQYPGCCDYPTGHRLDYGIKYK